MKRETFTIELIEQSNGYRATEPNGDVVGEGETAHDAVINYAERARKASKRKVATDGGE
jgi:hypothetical protein